MACIGWANHAGVSAALCCRLPHLDDRRSLAEMELS